MMEYFIKQRDILKIETILENCIRCEWVQNFIFFWKLNCNYYNLLVYHQINNKNQQILSYIIRNGYIRKLWIWRGAYK